MRILLDFQCSEGHVSEQFIDSQVREAPCAQCIVPAEGPEHEKYPTQFVIDLTRCIFCGFCQEACPKAAIKLNNLYELAQYQKEVLVRDIERATQAKSEMRTPDWL